jgi:hypothetical protein
VRNFVDFDWIGESSSEPAGSEIAEDLRSALEAQGFNCDAPLPRSEYGWEVSCTRDSARLLMVVQKSDRWLVIIERVGLRRLLFRKFGVSELREACEVVHGHLVDNSRFTNVTWRTREEFEKSRAGSSVPS